MFCLTNFIIVYCLHNLREENSRAELIDDCCCFAYSSSCYKTASVANCWTIRILFIALTTSYLEESVPAWELPVINVPGDFFEFFPTKLAARSKPPSILSKDAKT